MTSKGDGLISCLNFISTSHVPGKMNPVADALSRRPTVNAISIAYHHDFTSMRDAYANDEDFATMYKTLQEGKTYETFSLKEGFMMHGNRLCIMKELREKVMSESHAPPYAGHRGILTTLKAIETYFYWPTMKHDVQHYVEECVTC